MSGSLGWDRRTDEAITALAAKLASSHDAAELPSLVVDACAQGLEPDALALFRARESGDDLELVDHRGLSLESVQRVGSPSLTNDGLLARTCRERVVRCVDPVGDADDELTKAIHRDHPGAQTEVAIPFVFRDCALGALVLAFERGDAVGPDALNRLATFGRVAGLAFGEALSRNCAIESAEAILRAQNAQRVIVEALSILPERQLQASVRRHFYSWPQKSETTVDDFIEGVIQKVVDEARVLVRAEIAAIGIGDEPDRPFALWCYSGFPEAARAKLQTPRPVGTLGIVARQGETLRLPDVTKHPAFAGLPPGHPPLRSFLGVPIEYRGQPLGNLYLANKFDGGEFSLADQQAIEALARQTALALQQAYLQSAVEAQRAQCQSLVDSVPNGLMFVDSDNEHVVANPSAMQIFGMTIASDEGASQYLRLLTYPDGAPVPFEELPSFRALRGEEHPSEQFIVTRRDGTQVPILSTAAPVRGFGQKILGAVVNFEDLSPLRDLERMRDLERARQEFNASVAHDLRNPIQTVIAQIYSLLKKADGDEVRVPVEALRRIERSATSLGRITSLLLDVARVELRRIDLRREPKYLSDVVEEITTRLRPRLEADGHELDLVLEDRSLVDIDVGTFEQVVDNLLDNAAKFSPSGSRIRVSVRSSEGGVLLSVEDEGAGIALSEQAHVFDRRYRTDTVRERRAGLGLGLFIVRSYVEAHGGHVWLKSELGQGSTFNVWLPRYVGPVRHCSAPAATH